MGGIARWANNLDKYRVGENFWSQVWGKVEYFLNFSQFHSEKLPTWDDLGSLISVFVTIMKYQAPFSRLRSASPIYLAQGRLHFMIKTLWIRIPLGAEYYLSLYTYREFFPPPKLTQVALLGFFLPPNAAPGNYTHPWLTFQGHSPNWATVTATRNIQIPTINYDFTFWHMQP